MTRTNGVREPILARLRQGPLPTGDWRGLCQSQHALAANIHLLRMAGHDITTTALPGCAGAYVLTERP